MREKPLHSLPRHQVWANKQGQGCTGEGLSPRLSVRMLAVTAKCPFWKVPFKTGCACTTTLSMPQTQSGDMQHNTHCCTCMACTGFRSLSEKNRCNADNVGTHAFRKVRGAAQQRWHRIRRSHCRHVHAIGIK